MRSATAPPASSVGRARSAASAEVASSGPSTRRSRNARGVRARASANASTASSAASSMASRGWTAVAPTATQAEVEAKSLFLAGDVARAAAEADESGVPAVLVTRSGDVRLAGGLG